MSNFSNRNIPLYIVAPLNGTDPSNTIAVSYGGNGVPVSGETYGWPAAPFFAEIDRGTTAAEVVKVTEQEGNGVSRSYTITRAANLGSDRYNAEQFPHPVNSPIVPIFSAADATFGNNASPSTRSINTDSPLAGGGNLTQDRTLSITDGGIQASKLATDSVETDKIKDSAVTDEKIATGVSQSKITNLENDINSKSNVGHTHPQADVENLVTDLSSKTPATRKVDTGTGLSGGGDLTLDRTISISNGGVDTTQLADGAVETSKIDNGAVTNDKLATGISQSKITNLESDLAGKLAIDNKQVRYFEASTSTAANTAAKVATTSGGSYTPTSGDLVALTLSSANTAASPTLNIDGSGAKAIQLGTVAATAVSTSGATKIFLWYDGTAFQMFGSYRTVDTDTTYVSTPTTFTSVTGTTQAISGNVAYLANHASTEINFTLPATAAVGTSVSIRGLGSGKWRVTAPSGDNIIINGESTNTAGYISATNRYDAVTLICIVANTTWAVVGQSGILTKDGTPPPSDNMLYKGEWVAGNYKVNDSVFYDGQMYFCVSDTSEEPPGSDWKYFGEDLSLRTFTGVSPLEGGGSLDQNRTITVEEGGIDTIHIADEAITEDKLDSWVANRLRDTYRYRGTWQLIWNDPDWENFNDEEIPSGTSVDSGSIAFVSDTDAETGATKVLQVPTLGQSVTEPFYGNFIHSDTLLGKGLFVQANYKPYKYEVRVKSRANTQTLSGIATSLPNTATNYYTSTENNAAESDYTTYLYQGNTSANVERGLGISNVARTTAGSFNPTTYPISSAQNPSYVSGYRIFENIEPDEPYKKDDVVLWLGVVYVATEDPGAGVPGDSSSWVNINTLSPEPFITIDDEEGEVTAAVSNLKLIANNIVEESTTAITLDDSDGYPHTISGNVEGFSLDGYIPNLIATNLTTLNAKVPVELRVQGQDAWLTDNEHYVRWKGSEWIPVGGRSDELVVFTSNGTFNPASYPYARCFEVEVIGGGGAGGGSVAASAGQNSAGGGGGAGGVAKSVIPASDLTEIVTVTIGAGGTGVSGNDGNNGGTSSFGSLVTASGGIGGTTPASGVGTTGHGGYGGSGSAGQLLGHGAKGCNGTGYAGLSYRTGDGGSSAYGGGGRAGANVAGGGGHGYGAGGGGAGSNASQPARAGGNGRPGIVNVWVRY